MGLDGGGDPCFSTPETKRLYQRGASVSAIDPLDLDDDLVFCVGKMGTPFAPQEKLGNGEAITETGGFLMPGRIDGFLDIARPAPGSGQRRKSHDNRGRGPAPGLFARRFTPRARGWRRLMRPGDQPGAATTPCAFQCRPTSIPIPPPHRPSRDSLRLTLFPSKFPCSRGRFSSGFGSTSGIVLQRGLCRP